MRREPFLQSYSREGLIICVGFAWKFANYSFCISTLSQSWSVDSAERLGHGQPHLHDETVGDILSGCLARPHNLHDLPPRKAIVPRNRIGMLHAWELRVLQFVLLQQCYLLLLHQTIVSAARHGLSATHTHMRKRASHLLREKHVFRYQYMFSDVDQKFCLLELL